MDITQDKIHKLIELNYDDRFSPFAHHYNSYNQFISECVFEEMKGPNLIYENESNGKVYKYKFRFNNVRLREPMDETSNDTNTVLFPEDFKSKFLTYNSRLIADVQQIQEVYTPETNTTVENINYEDKSVSIGKIPIMVKSNNCNSVLHKDKPNNECAYNPGGYFILKGAEKLVIPQESIIFNRALVFSKKDKTAVNKIAYTVQVYSKLVENLNSNLQIISIKFKKGNAMVLTMSQLSDIPICVLFKALGIVTDKDIIYHITMIAKDVDMSNIILASMEHYKSETWKFDPDDLKEPKKYINTQEDALNYLMTKMKLVGKRFSSTDAATKLMQKREYLHRIILERDFLPHMNSSDYRKGCFLGLMCNKLINCSLGRNVADDRDSLSNKRIDTVGILMGQIYRQAHKKMLADSTKYFRKKNSSDETPINVIPQIKHSIIEQNLNSPLSHGTWGASNKKGVAQMVERYTYLQFISGLKRVVTTQLSTSTKADDMRYAHATQYGFLDVPESPEGHNIGIVKQLSNIATISINAASQPAIIKEILDNDIIDLMDIHPTFFNQYTRVMLNGEWLGMTNKPIQIAAMLKSKRTGGEIEKQVCIAHNINKKEININTDAGRMLRPLLRVVNNKLVLTDKMLDEINIKNKSNPLQIHKWVDFLMKYPETVDFVDPEEQETLMIAFWVKDVEENHRKMNTIIPNPDFFGDPVNRYDDTVYKRYTHCELHPSTTNGNVLSNAIFPDHNDAPRNYFNFAQQKQAIGIYASNYRHRVDIAYTLYNPQRPLVFSRTAKYTNALELPFGQNCMVAICMYTGYNQEDSILMKRSAINRGLFTIESYRKESISISKTTSGQDETFCKPDKNRVTSMKDGNYDKLNSRGFVQEETDIKNGDIIYGKTTPITPNDDDDEEKSAITARDSSMAYKSGVDGTIDKVYTDIRNGDGYPTYNTRIRQQRIPVGGDKFCCYTSDHDVLTDNGWKAINELTLDDRVACLDNGWLMYHNPEELQEYDYSDKLYKIKSNQIDLVVTPNHRMYVGNRNGDKFSVKTAEDIYGKRYTYQKNVEYFEPEYIMEEFVIPGVNNLDDLIVDMDCWLIFFGIWIAEGCTLRDWGLSFATHKQRVKDELTRVCEVMDFDIRKHIDKSGDTVCNAWCYNDKRLVQYFLPLSVGAINKSLPEWVWELSQEQCRVLIDGMMLGDGHTMKNGTRRYDTSSTQLADDFQRLCLHAGWSCNKLLKYEVGHSTTTSRGDTITSTVDAFRLTIITSQNTPLVNKNITKEGENRHDTWIDFDDEDLCECVPNKVFCCTVPGDGIIYVRRRGYCAFSGNSRHGQKGTIGYILNDENMPFNEQGIRPDIIINACCIPSRMTIGQLIESVMNKYAAIEGRTIQIDHYEHLDMAPILARLEEYKNEIITADVQNLTKEDLFKYGSETLYCGFDGKKMENQVFMNITYYLRLKHLVQDKIHARARGPMTVLIRQPPEGRSRDGGLRLGEMERDVFISYGLSLTLKEKFMELSDGHTTHVCSTCGLIARKKLNKNVYTCDACEAILPQDKPAEKPYIHTVRMPYACKIFIQELMSIGILPRIRTPNNEFTNAI